MTHDSTRDWKERLQDYLDDDRQPGTAELETVRANQTMSTYWRNLTEIRGAFRSGLERLSTDASSFRIASDVALSRAVTRAIRSRVRSGLRPGAEDADRVSRRQRTLLHRGGLAAAAVLVLAFGAFLYRYISIEQGTRQLVRQEVTLIVNNMYSENGNGLGGVVVPSDDQFVDGVMNSVQAAVDPSSASPDVGGGISTP